MLYHAYRRWSEETGNPVLAQKTFGTRLAERRGLFRKRSGGIWWHGIAVRNDRNDMERTSLYSPSSPPSTRENKGILPLPSNLPPGEEDRHEREAIQAEGSAA